MKDLQNLTEIIAGCKRGREDAFSQLVDIYAKRLYGYFYRLTASRDAGDDLLSELFVKLIEKIGTYRHGSFDAWIFTIALNIFHDHQRRRQRDNNVLAAQKERLLRSSHPSAAAQTNGIDQLQKSLEKLDPKTKELIVLRFYSQLSFKEMAEMQAEPIGTVLSKVHRGLKKLRELMQK